MRGIGEMDVNQPAPVSNIQSIDDSCPYLILDIRDRDEYDACHLITGECCHRILTYISIAILPANIFSAGVVVICWSLFGSC